METQSLLPLEASLQESFAFDAHPDGSNVLQEYRAVLGTMALTPALLASSPFQATLQYLSAQPPPPRAEALLPALIQRAFALPSPSAARSASRPLPHVGLLAPLPLYASCLSFIQALRWEGPSLCAALSLLQATEAQDGLALIVSLMCHASTSCASRRREALCSILKRVPLPLDKGSPAGPFAPEDDPLKDLAAALPPAAAAAARRLHAASAACVQDIKDRAFASTFVQPCLMLASAAVATDPQYQYILMDAEVHGAPSLAALLQAAVGVRVSRAPELNDEATGFVDAVAATARGDGVVQLSCLWEPSALGRSWESLAGARGWTLRTLKTVPLDVFCGWRGSRLDRQGIPTVLDFAAQCADPSPANAERRRLFAETYLAQFARYFQEGFLIERVLTALFALPTEDLTVFLKGAAALLGVSEAEEGELSMDWLLDDATFPPTVHKQRARKLLELLAVLKTA